MGMRLMDNSLNDVVFFTFSKKDHICKHKKIKIKINNFECFLFISNTYIFCGNPKNVDFLKK